MIIDLLCWIGIIIASLFGIGVIIAMAMVVAMVTSVRREQKHEQQK